MDVTGLFSNGVFEKKFEQRPYWILLAVAICIWSKESRLLGTGLYNPNRKYMK